MVISIVTDLEVFGDMLIAPYTCKKSEVRGHLVHQLRNKLPEEVVSASSVSAFISRLNSMCVSFLMFCFSAVCFFIYVSFRAVVSAFEPFCPVDTVLLFTVFTVLYLC